MEARNPGAPDWGHLGIIVVGLALVAIWWLITQYEHTQCMQALQFTGGSYNYITMQCQQGMVP